MLQQEFHNHEVEITKQTENFINSWFKQSITEESLELSDQFILPERKTLDKKFVVKQIKNIFSDSVKYVGGRFDIIDATFELMGQGKGMGSSEGAAGYRVVLKDGTSKIVSGPFKLYFALQNEQWKIVNLVFPGFAY